MLNLVSNADLEECIIQAREDNYESARQDETKEFDQLLKKRNILLARQEDYMKKIRDIGVLPADAFEKYVFLPWILRVLHSLC